MINLKKPTRESATTYYIITIYNTVTQDIIERITDTQHLTSCLDRIIDEFNINNDTTYNFCCNKADFCEDGYLVKSSCVLTSK